MSSLYLNWHPLVDIVNIFHSDRDTLECDLNVLVRRDDLMSSFPMDA
jgi:hypothetical protein